MQRTPPLAPSETATIGSLAALIVADAPGGVQPHGSNESVRFGGMNLVEWAATTAHRAGIDRIHLVGTAPVDAKMLSRLRSSGVCVTTAEHDGRPFHSAPTDDTVVLLSAYTIVEPAVITTLLERATKAADYASLLVDSRTEAAASLDVMTLGWASVDRIRRARSLTDAANRLMRANLLQSIPLGDSFAACLHAVSELKELERRYASHMRGARRQRFTAVIERLASPFSQLRAQYHF